MTSAPLRYALTLVLFYLVVAAVTLARGDLAVTGHEVDLIHSLDIAYRMEAGAWPHLDYMTPLGILSVLPLKVFIGMGYGPGMSFHLAQLLVCAILMPGIWWIGVSRFGGWTRIFYGLAMVMLATALIFGGKVPSVSAAMYYNRWAWVLAGFIIFIAFLPARAGWRSTAVDGAILGLSGAVLVLIKVTYVMALAPLVLVYFLQSRDGRLFIATVIAGLAGLALATAAFGGVSFWQAYVGDLLALAGGSSRPHPGVEIDELLAGPSFLPISLILGLAIILWRKTQLDQAGLLLLVAAPGFVYITFQNWGNDPKWLFFLAFLLLTLRPPNPEKMIMGMTGRTASVGLAVLALFLIAPTMITIATSHLRHLTLPRGEYMAMFTRPEMSDIKVMKKRVYEATRTLDYPAITYPPDVEPAESAAEETPVTLNGEVLEECNIGDGLLGWTRKAVEQLSAVDGIEEEPLIVADVYDYLWLFGPLKRSPGMAPWYYGTDGGFEEAKYVLVPLCPVSPHLWRAKLENIRERGWQLEEVLRTDLFILVRREG